MSVEGVSYDSLEQEGPLINPIVYDNKATKLKTGIKKNGKLTSGSSTSRPFTATETYHIT